MTKRPASDIPAGAGSVKRVFFHVGAPKSGTTFVQDTLLANRDRLAAAGVFYPFERRSYHLFASLGLIERKWAGTWDPMWAEVWADTARRVRESSCDRAVLSNEIMGLATPAQAGAAVAAVQPAEVHVVFTARDLGRQLPSDWQEQVKHRHTVTLTKFVDDLIELGIDAPKPFGELFWGLHDPVRVLASWAEHVPAEHIHVVTVPPSGSSPTLLWERLAGLLEIDPELVDLDEVRSNRSMGVIETEFLRRFNLATRGTLTSSHGPAINRLLGQSILSEVSISPPARLPDRHFAWVEARSLELIDGLSIAGYDIVGDLDELLPLPSPTPSEGPPHPPEALAPAVVIQAAYPAVAGLLREVVGLRGRVRVLTEKIKSLKNGDEFLATLESDEVEDFD